MSELSFEANQKYWAAMDDGTRLLADDPFLVQYAGDYRRRYQKFQGLKQAIEEKEGGLECFSRGYERFGLHERDDGVHYQEWAPNASSLSLIGEFNGWNREANPCTRNEFGVWSCFVPRNPDGSSKIPHLSLVKASVGLACGGVGDRVPAWIQCTRQHGTQPLDGRHWAPAEPYRFQHGRPQRPSALRIYEAHVGMSSEEGRVATYREFADNIIPYIADTGYNCVQLMATMEHAYYASFGYQITNFFACASRCGTPADLQYLVDKAHSYGLVVLMDLVHSHASKNVVDGLNMFDGTDHMYFHAGARGQHDLWDSRLFDYGNWETLRFLLSNLRYYMEFYMFDGFRFDGVTSMLYTHHGLGTGFSGGYHEYFGLHVDEDCLAYLTLTNHMLHALYPHCITIAEDVSGMPGLCRAVGDGGVGFDYRLAMAIPDMWIKMLKEQRDDDWNLDNVAFTLQNRRYKEPVIAYAESHDQALVGDKTLAFWLMDKEMYTGMTLIYGDTNPIVTRGIALHKLLRLVTCFLGGEGYLTFMGNEFGHPEWIDFPREGNGSSFHYCRRQWSLPRDPNLRYKHLLSFERAMNRLEEQRHWLAAAPAYVSLKNEGDKILAFERAGLVCVFNFHPTQSFTSYRIGVSQPGSYRVVLDTDQAEHGGHTRIDASVLHHSQPYAHDGREHSVQLYLPCRTALVLARE
eukprot:gnl/Trimastix_PCT/862.p1 GENE.gnl/Trimastix_PCT/862~~gnl/Trimastix_PCT/862.p1  ORF type:complete len:689 (-),score=167.60 gnl/Trimastix_PCT/862:67-2133(-)